MTNGPSRPTKKERQSAAREHARQLREEAKKKARRRRIITQSSIGAGILVVLVVIAIVIVQLAKPASTAGPANMASDGILLTSTTKAVTTPALKSGESPKATKQADDGKAHITLYEDLQCPVCKTFEQANDAQIAQWLDAGEATIEIHPISFLDSSSNGNRYSSRAANAMACVAQYAPDKFWDVNKAFYDNQPDENTNGLSDKKIIANIKAGGVSNSKVSTCVTTERFKGWVTSETNRAMDGKKKIPNSSLKKVEGTPTIIVNGQSYTPPTSSTTGYADTDAFATFVAGLSTAVAQGGATATPSATPAG